MAPWARWGVCVRFIFDLENHLTLRLVHPHRKDYNNETWISQLLLIDRSEITLGRFEVSGNSCLLQNRNESLCLAVLNYSGPRFEQTSEVIMLPDDCTVGFIVEIRLGISMVHSNMFHSHLENLLRLTPSDIPKQVRCLSWFINGTCWGKHDWCSTQVLNLIPNWSL